MPGYGDFTMPPPAKQTAASLASEGAEPKMFAGNLSEWGLLDGLQWSPKWKGFTFLTFQCKLCGDEVPLYFCGGMQCKQCGAQYESRVMIRRLEATP